MACHHPIPAWRSALGVVTLREPLSRKGDEEYLRLPCGTCLGCRKARAREWAFRCTLEAQQHDEASFVTLTYDDLHLPPTLRKGHLSAWIKRVRARLEPRRVRFFASGEYGDKLGRPHYHALMFGVSDHPALRQTWDQGFVHVDKVTPASIAYVAGYCSKKVGWKLERGERLDPNTGELYEYEPPFILMSRRPGIGGHAKQHSASWRKEAIYNGQPIPVPRFLHQSWLNKATPQQVEDLKKEKAASAIDSSKDRLRAAALIALTKHNLDAQRRTK